MEELFILYSNLYKKENITPEDFKDEINKIKNLNNMWILEVIYSFFMLGYKDKDK